MCVIAPKGASKSCLSSWWGEGSTAKAPRTQVRYRCSTAGRTVQVLFSSQTVSLRCLTLYPQVSHICATREPQSVHRWPCRGGTVRSRRTHVISHSYVVNTVARRVLLGSHVSGGPVGCQARGLEPVLRKEGGGSGQKPRAGRWPGPRQTGLRTGKTPRTRRGGLTAERSRADGARRRSHGAEAEYPEEEKPTRGADRPEL